MHMTEFEVGTKLTTVLQDIVRFQLMSTDKTAILYVNCLIELKVT